MPEQQPAVKYKSHRWAGGNTAIAAYYGFDEQLKATTDLLKSGVISVDIFAVQSKAVENIQVNTPMLGDQAENSALSAKNFLNVSPGATISVDVVAANRGVGHSFPAELRDMFEAWLEFQVTDAGGADIYHSGAIQADGNLEMNAHAYRNVPIGRAGRSDYQTRYLEYAGRGD